MCSRACAPMIAHLLLCARICSACGIPFCSCTELLHGVCDHGHPGSSSCRTGLFHAAPCPHHHQGTARSAEGEESLTARVCTNSSCQASTRGGAT